MASSRRTALATIAAALTAARAQVPGPQPQDENEPIPNEQRRLPNGKLQSDAIAEQRHKDALKTAKQLIALANDIKSDIEKAGNFVVPIATIKKTEEAEKLARKIHHLLQG